MPDTSKALLPGDEGAAEALKYVLSQQSAPEQPPAPPDEPAEKQAEEEKAPEGTEPAKAADGNPGEVPPDPEAEAGGDEAPTAFDWIADESVRADVEAKNLSPETLAYLKQIQDDAAAKEKEYARGFHARMRDLAAKEKAAEARIEAADNFDRLMEDDKHRAAWLKSVKELEKPSDPIDYSTATPEEIEARNREIAREEARKVTPSEDDLPQHEQTALRMADYFDELDGEIDEDGFNEACLRLRAQLESDDKNPVEFLTPKNLVTWLQPHVREVAMESAAKRRAAEVQAEKSKREAARIANASSPKGTGSVSGPTPPVWVRENRKPTDEEKKEQTLRLLEERGVRLTRDR